MFKNVSIWKRFVAAIAAVTVTSFMAAAPAFAGDGYDPGRTIPLVDESVDR